jgi:amino acid adenylation domain-containing protein
MQQFKQNIEFGLEPVTYNPFGEAEITKLSSLSEAQKEVWLSCKLGGREANLSYNESTSLELHGELDAGLIWKACDMLIERHESLRMSFSGDGKSLMIYKHLDPFRTERDFSVFDAEERSEALNSFLLQEVSGLFDLNNGPLLRISLIKLEESKHLLTFTAHHLVCDGWSFGVIFEEVAAIYSALKEQKPIHLSEPILFSQYAREMEEYSQSPEYVGIEQYWLKEYQDIPEPLDLPTDRPRPDQRQFKAQRDDFKIPESLAAELKDLGKKYKASLVSTIMASFEVFLYQITGQKDIVLGLPAAGQAATGNLALVGHCVNLLPIRSQIDPQLSFGEYLSKRRLKLLDDFEHQQITFGNLIKKLKIVRDSSKIPLVPVVFNIDMGMDDQVNFLGLNHRLISNPRAYENFDLALNVSKQGEDLVFEWSYQLGLFEPETIAQWMQAFQQLLSVCCENPGKKIIDLNETTTIPEEYLVSGKIEPEIQNNSILHILQDISKKFPDNLALASEGVSLTYSDLELKTKQLGAALQAQGLKKGEVVGIILPRDSNLPLAMLGILKAGGAFLPIDPALPEERIAYMLVNAQCHHVLTDPSLGDFSRVGLKVFFGHELILQGKKTNLEAIQFNLPTEDDLAYVLYTSGSTGQPKGVKVTHGNFANFLHALSETLKLGEKDCSLALTTVSFDISLFELFVPLVKGGSVYIASTDLLYEGRNFAEIIRKNKITLIQGTPSTWRVLFGSGFQEKIPLKVLTGGEGISLSIAEKLNMYFGGFWFGYGPTETTVVSSIQKITDPSKISVGKPIYNTHYLIMNENSKPLKIGRIGEVLIGGLGVSQGYLGQEELVKEKFVVFDLQGKGSCRFYKTGDLGWIDQLGELHIVGRKDAQVKIRGYRIELGEIEAQLNKLEQVAEAVVMVGDRERAEKELQAFVLLKSEYQGVLEIENIQIIKKQLKYFLPDYMIPNQWVFPDAFPLTPNQKIDRKKLQDFLPSASNTYQEEKRFSELESLIHGIWKKHLGAREIGLFDNFFDLGGHSLMAVDVVSELEKALGRELFINSMFKYPVLSDYAAFLDESIGEKVDWSCLVPMKPSGTRPPLYMVHGVGCSVTSFYALAEGMPEDQPVYGFQVKGLNGIDEPHHSLEEMAAHYVDLMLQHNPEGPYYVSGYSFGGYVAFEMVHQLLKKGIFDVKLILFDTAVWNKDDNKSLGEKVVQEILRRKAEWSLFIKFPTYFIQNKKEAFRKKLEKKFNIKLVDENSISERRQIIKRLTSNNEKLINQYTLPKISKDMYLFKVKWPDFYMQDMEFYGWKDFTENVKVIPLPGHHEIIFKDTEILKAMVFNLQSVLNES